MEDDAALTSSDASQNMMPPRNSPEHQAAIEAEEQGSLDLI